MKETKTHAVAPGPAEEVAGSVVAANPIRKASVHLVVACGIAQALSLIAEIGNPSLGSNRAA